MVKRPIRLAYCIDGMGVGGTELNALRTAEQLDRQRFAISVVALRAEGPLRARYDAAAIPVHSVPIRSLYHPTTVVAAGRLARYFAREQVDIVHCHDPYTNVFAATAARLSSTPVVLTSRRWLETPFRSRSLAMANAVAYRFADRVIANSTSVARSLERKEHVDPRRITVIPNFVEEDAFCAPSAADRSRMYDELQLEEGDLIVGVVARLALPKDHATLLAAAPRLRADFPRLRIVLVGDGPRRNAIEAESRAMGIDDIVRFAGTRPSRPSMHHLFDISVLPTLHEGFPNSVLEAMAAGRAVVASAVGGVPDAVIDGETGLLVPPADPARLAAALAQLLSNPALRHSLGSAAQSRARREFHSSDVLPRLADLYATWLGPR